MELTAKKIADALLEGPVLVVHDGRFPTHDLFAAARDALPKPADAERAEIKEIYESVGLEVPKGRPYRAPHYSAGVGGVLGTSRKLAAGTVKVYPGEVTLAHGGLLVLYDAPEFHRPVLEAIYESYKSGRAAVPMAGGGVAKLLAGFYLLGDMVACPCGKYGHPSCACTNDQIVRYHERARRTIGWETVIYQDAVQPNPRRSSSSPRRQPITAEEAQARRTQKYAARRERMEHMAATPLTLYAVQRDAVNDALESATSWARRPLPELVNVVVNVLRDHGLEMEGEIADPVQPGTPRRSVINVARVGHGTITRVGHGTITNARLIVDAYRLPDGRYNLTPRLSLKKDEWQPNPVTYAGEEIAETIIRQLGGASRLRAMLGPNLALVSGSIPDLGSKQGLIMRWGKRRVTSVWIGYDVGNDLYDVAIKTPGYDREYLYGVEASQLKPIIEDQTGYALSL